MLKNCLYDLAQVATGSPIDRSGSSARVAMVGDLDGSGALPHRLASAGPPKSGNSSNLQLGDIVVSMRGNSNLAAAIDVDDLAGPELFASLDLAVVRLNDPETVNPHYVANYINLPSTQLALSTSREGSAAKRLPIGAIRDLAIPLPSYSRQCAIAALAKEAAKERQLLERIATLRQARIHDLLRQAAETPTKEATQ